MNIITQEDLEYMLHAGQIGRTMYVEARDYLNVYYDENADPALRLFKLNDRMWQLRNLENWIQERGRNVRILSRSLPIDPEMDR